MPLTAEGDSNTFVLTEAQLQQFRDLGIELENFDSVQLLDSAPTDESLSVQGGVPSEPFGTYVQSRNAIVRNVIDRGLVVNRGGRFQWPAYVDRTPAGFYNGPTSVRGSGTKAASYTVLALGALLVAAFLFPPGGKK